MRLDLGFSLGHRIEQSHRLALSKNQKLELKLLLQHKLFDPEFPNMLHGFEGIIAADKILKKNNSKGVLVGGLSESVWNYNRTKDELYSHKDVDVIILDRDFTPERFEGGIDWWMPREKRIEFLDKYSNTNFTNSLWFRNFNGVVLGYKIRASLTAGNGLYILNREDIANTRLVEAKTGVGKAGTMFDEEVEEAFRNKKLKEMKKRVPNYIKEYFGERVLFTKSGYVNVEEFSTQEEYSKILRIESSI